MKAQKTNETPIESDQPARRKSMQDMYLDARGREIPDPVPMQPPIGYKATPSIMDQVRDMIKSESLRLAAQQSGMETFEEADDFEVGDDYDPSSPYEEVFEGIPTGRDYASDEAPQPLPGAPATGSLTPSSQVPDGAAHPVADLAGA